MTINLDRAAVLLKVIHETASVGLGFTNISAIATAELKAMDAEAGEHIAKAKAKVKPTIPIVVEPQPIKTDVLDELEETDNTVRRI